jgi:hypothetical protein
VRKSPRSRGAMVAVHGSPSLTPHFHGYFSGSDFRGRLEGPDAISRVCPGVLLRAIWRVPRRAPWTVSWWPGCARLGRTGLQCRRLYTYTKDMCAQIRLSGRRGRPPTTDGAPALLKVGRPIAASEVSTKPWVGSWSAVICEAVRAEPCREFANPIMTLRRLDERRPTEAMVCHRAFVQANVWSETGLLTIEAASVQPTAEW